MLFLRWHFDFLSTYFSGHCDFVAVGEFLGFIVVSFLVSLAEMIGAIDITLCVVCNVAAIGWVICRC